MDDRAGDGTDDPESDTTNADRDTGGNDDPDGGRDTGGNDDPDGDGHGGPGEAGSDRYGEGFDPGVDPADGPEEFDPGSGREDTTDDDLREELDDLRADLEAFEEEVEDRTVDREAVEDDLRAYVRARIRRGHARGWGPYLVLLYGTAMTIGAFVELSGVWAILAMVVIWLSTLGLYTLMVLFGVGVAAISAPGRAIAAVNGLLDRLRDLRS